MFLPGRLNFMAVQCLTFRVQDSKAVELLAVNRAWDVCASECDGVKPGVLGD